MRRMNLSGEPNCSNAETQRGRLISLVGFINNRLPVDKLIYKGGLFLNLHTGVSRYTQDVDLTIQDEELYVDFCKVLAEYGDKLVASGEIFRYEIKDTIEEHMSGGARYYDANDRVVLSIDVSFHINGLDSVVVESNEFGRVRISSVEQIIADKCASLFSRKRFRRAKDLYDLWLIVFNCTWDNEKLRKCLESRDIYPLPIALNPYREECISEMKKAYEKLLVRDPVSEEQMDKPDFATVVKYTSRFMTKFMEAEG